MHLTTEQAGRVSIVRIGETRLMYPILGDFSSAINHLVSDRETLHEMRLRAIAASTRFMWDSEQQKLLYIYSQLAPAADRRTAAAA